MVVIPVRTVDTEKIWSAKTLGFKVGESKCKKKGRDENDRIYFEGGKECLNFNSERVRKRNI